MKFSTLLGIVSAMALAASCFLPWVYIESAGITVSGVQAAGTNFGKPGYFHLLMGFFFLLLTLVPNLWAKRANLLVVSLNIAWALRNFIIVTTCSGGECPEKKSGLYLLLIASLLMFISAVTPPTPPGKIKEEERVD